MTEDHIVSVLAGHRACRSQREVRACSALIAEAVFEERERCARIADEFAVDPSGAAARARIARRIRATLRAPDGAQP